MMHLNEFIIPMSCSMPPYPSESILDIGCCIACEHVEQRLRILSTSPLLPPFVHRGHEVCRLFDVVLGGFRLELALNIATDGLREILVRHMYRCRSRGCCSYLRQKEGTFVRALQLFTDLLSLCRQHFQKAPGNWYVSILSCLPVY